MQRFWSMCSEVHEVNLAGVICDREEVIKGGGDKGRRLLQPPASGIRRQTLASISPPPAALGPLRG